MPSISVALVSHVWTPEIQLVFDRLRREAPADHDVTFLLSADAGEPDPPIEADRVVRVSREDVFRLPYPQKCHPGPWVMAGNLDLVFLEFKRRMPNFLQYWFVEYDVHFEGHWGRLFEHFRASNASIIGAIQEYISKVPHKLNIGYPPLVVPDGMAWEKERLVKGFFPLCRLSPILLDALDSDYRAGLGGHYEITMPTVAAQHGQQLEDFGGSGSFVRPENRNRFYFANNASYSHSPGNFVFRPNIRKVLPRKNTLWHPVKPEGVPLWYPIRPEVGVFRRIIEDLKLPIGQACIQWWFATRWRPLL